MASENSSQNFLRIPVDPPNANIDIVAVHGLNPMNTENHAEQTWILDGKCWLKEFLPKRIPKARIFLFGYNANVAFETSTAGVTAHSMNLLNRLRSKRRATPNRPIIFVCHSLGGIVVKQALVQARLNRTYDTIHAATYGIAFFGTPHRGGNNTYLGEIGAKIARAVMREPSNALLEALKKESLYADEMRENFSHSLERLKILSFYETRSFKKLGIIVDERSATFGLEGSREQRLALDADHSHICKFASEEDDKYEQVADNLEEMVEEALKEASPQAQSVTTQPPIRQAVTSTDVVSPDLEACLRSLSFPEMFMREYSVAEATGRTCVWLLNHKAYRSWMETSGSLLWITGKAGSGKSTLMKFAHSQPKKDADIVLSFYFNGRGSQIEKTSIGMYRSLLFQLLPFVSQQQKEKMSNSYMLKCRNRGEASVSWEWHETELSGAFTELITDLKDYHIRIYIDALDEAGEHTAVQLVSKFQAMIQEAAESRAFLNICCSCRPYPLIAEEGLTVCMQDENAYDIELYVRDRLEAAPHSWKQIKILASAITIRAHGVFQWVCIVLRWVLQDLKARRSTEDILFRLEKMPKELDELYEEIISGLESNRDRLECANLMRWMCFAPSLLSVSELRHALLLQQDSTFASLKDLQSHTLYVDNDRDMEVRVVDISRGLVEIHEYQDGERVAVLIHETVRNFLIHSGGLRTLEKSPSMDPSIFAARACLQLAWCSVQYLEAFVLDRSFLDFAGRADEYPLTLYAVRTWFRNPFLSDDPEIIDGYYNLFIHMGYPREGPNRLQKWLPWFRLACPETAHFLQGDALEFELAHQWGHYAVASKLMANYIVSQIVPLSIMEAVLSETSFTKHWLKHPDGNVNIQDITGQTPLHYSIIGFEHSRDCLFRALIDHKRTKINIQDRSGMTPLHLAVSYKSTELVQVLLGCKDIQVNIQDNGGYTPLHRAVDQNSPEIVQMLLVRREVNVNIQSILRFTPLHQAIVRKYPEIVRLLLLNKDININLQGHLDESPLHQAIEQNSPEIVQMLLVRREVNVNIQNVLGFTPLHQAIGKNYPEIIKLLLAHKDIKVNIQAFGENTPLHQAIEKDSPEIVALLLGHKDVKVDWPIENGKRLSPLKHVKKWPPKNRAIIDLLEEKHQEQMRCEQQEEHAFRPRKRIKISHEQNED